MESGVQPVERIDPEARSILLFLAGRSAAGRSLRPAALVDALVASADGAALATLAADNYDAVVVVVVDDDNDNPIRTGEWLVGGPVDRVLDLVLIGLSGDRVTTESFGRSRVVAEIDADSNPPLATTHYRVERGLGVAPRGDTLRIPALDIDHWPTLKLLELGAVARALTSWLIGAPTQLPFAEGSEPWRDRNFRVFGEAWPIERVTRLTLGSRWLVVQANPAVAGHHCVVLPRERLRTLGAERGPATPVGQLLDDSAGPGVIGVSEAPAFLPHDAPTPLAAIDRQGRVRAVVAPLGPDELRVGRSTDRVLDVSEPPVDPSPLEERTEQRIFLDAPDYLEVGSTAAAYVTIAGPDPDGITSSAHRRDGTRLTVGTTANLDIIVRVDGPLAVEGRAIRQVRPQGRTESTVLEFVLRPLTRARSSAYLWVDVRQRGELVGGLAAAKVSIDQRHAVTSDQRASRQHRTVGLALEDADAGADSRAGRPRRPPPSSSATVAPGEPALLLISRGEPYGTLTFELADEAGTRCGTAAFTDSDARLVDHVGEYYDERAGGGDLDPEDYARFGRGLFTRMPAELQEVLRDPGWAPRSLVLMCDETVQVPWELTCVSHPERGSTAPGSRFLGQFGLIRSDHPPTRIGRRGSPRVLGVRYGLFPDYPSWRRLARAKDEGHDLKKRFGVVNLARYSDAFDTLASGNFDLFHFGGHGHRTVVNEGIVVMDEGTERKIGSHELAGFPLDRQPLVVVNACHSGALQSQFDTIHGLRTSFLEAGAGAFVGSQRAVADNVARRFADRFYTELLEHGRSLAEATAAVRTDESPDLRLAALWYVVASDSPSLRYVLPTSGRA